MMDGKRNAISLCYEHNRSEEDSFDLVAFPRCWVRSEGTPPTESFLSGLGSHYNGRSPLPIGDNKSSSIKGGFSTLQCLCFPASAYLIFRHYLLLWCVFCILLHSVLLYIYRSFHPSTRDMVNSGLFSQYNHLAKVHAANQFLLLHRRVESLPYQNSPCSCSSSMEHRVQHWFSCSYWN